MKRLEGLKQSLDEGEKEEGVKVKNSVDLTDVDNLDVRKASLEVTNRQELTVQHDRLTDDDRLPDLDIEDVEKIIDKLASEGVEELVITGGEPTLREDIERILQYAINRIDTVSIQTDGTNPIPFSDYDCNVVVEVDSIDLLKNNEIRRMTDPEEFDYDMSRGVLVDNENLVCRFCGTQVTGGEQQIARHLGKEHQKGMIQSFNDRMKEEGGTVVEDYESLKKHGDFEWRMFYTKSGFPIEEEEKALQKAFKTAKLVDNPVTIRATIFNHNDLMALGYMANQIGADAVFVPLKPVGRAKNMEEKYISPGRFKESIRQVLTLNALHSNDYRIDHPLYLYSEYTASEKYGDIESRLSYERYVEFWKRGRASEVGISKIHVGVDGTVYPSPYLMDYDLGNMLKTEWKSIYQELTQFNNMLSNKQETIKADNFDVKQNTLFADPVMLLENPYKNNKEVN